MQQRHQHILLRGCAARHFDGRLKNGSLYVGRIEARTGDPVDDKDVKIKFESEILAHAGIRVIGEPTFPTPNYGPNPSTEPERLGLEASITHEHLYRNERIITVAFANVKQPKTNSTNH